MDSNLMQTEINDAKAQYSERRHSFRTKKATNIYLENEFCVIFFDMSVFLVIINDSLMHYFVINCINKYKIEEGK